jgi:GTP cyclohydrolase I
MTTRGVHKSAASLVTSRMPGVFRRQAQTRQEFLAALDLRGSGSSTAQMS